ncbi:MAG: hypothetical protein AB7N71_02320 [Phycisphaerae bacterium]
MRARLFASLMTVGLTLPAFAGLLPGEQVYNSDLAGTGEVGDGGPYYTSGLPAWVNGGSLAASLSSPIAGIPGFSAFMGTVDSAVYYVNGVDASAGMGFTYRINLDANSAPRLVRAALGPSIWSSITILDEGADGSGNSTAASGNTTWTDGDPYFIEREATTGAPAWNFRFGTDGTRLDPTNSSALVWFETDAEYFENGGTITLLDGGAAGAARVLTVGIPSPTAGVLTIIGSVVLAGMRRRM